MGYFSNGTEGDMFEAKWCARCVHGDNHRGDDKGCPVMLTHVLFSYEECNSDSNAKRMLDILIPREGAWNEQCAMFHPARKAPDSRQLSLLASTDGAK